MVYLVKMEKLMSLDIIRYNLIQKDEKTNKIIKKVVYCFIM